MSTYKLILSIVFLSVSSLALADENTSVETKKVVEKTPWNLDLTLETSTNRILNSQADHSASISFTVEPHYTFDPDLKISGYFSASKALNDEQDFTVSDGLILGYFKKYELNPFLKFQPVGMLLLPLSDRSRLENSTQLGLYAGGRLHFTMKPFQIERLSGFYELRFNRNLHKFETSVSGSSNTRYSIRNRFAISWGFLPKWSFVNDFRFIHGWSYQGNAKLSFELINEVNHQISDAVSVALGHRNSGNAMKANGVDSNVGIISDKGSEFYGYVSYGL